MEEETENSTTLVNVRHAEHRTFKTVPPYRYQIIFGGMSGTLSLFRCLEFKTPAPHPSLIEHAPSRSGSIVPSGQFLPVITGAISPSNARKILPIPG